MARAFSLVFLSWAWGSGLRGKRWWVGPAQTAPPICKPVSGPRPQNGAFPLVSAAPDRTAACAMPEHQTETSCQPDTWHRITNDSQPASPEVSEPTLGHGARAAQFAPALLRLNHRTACGCTCRFIRDLTEPAFPNSVLAPWVRALLFKIVLSHETHNSGPFLESWGSIDARESRPRR